jgi:hypothetical protein
VNLFEDLMQRVTLLNTCLRPVEHNIGSEARTILHKQLWRIVGELNDRLNLGLENTALDLHVDGGRLIIHYYSGGRGSGESEINIFIDPGFAVERHTKDLRTGSIEIMRG